MVDLEGHPLELDSGREVEEIRLGGFAPGRLEETLLPLQGKRLVPLSVLGGVANHLYAIIDGGLVSSLLSDGLQLHNALVDHLYSLVASLDIGLDHRDV